MAVDEEIELPEIKSIGKVNLKITDVGPLDPPACSIADVMGYIEMRIQQADSQIATEELAGNEVKAHIEQSARAELVGLLCFIKDKQHNTGIRKHHKHKRFP